MTRMRPLLSLRAFACAAALIHFAAQAAEPPSLPGPAEHLWRPVADESYLQEFGEQIRTEQPVKAVAVYRDAAFCVVGNSLRMLRDGALQELPAAPVDVSRLKAMGGALWAAAPDGTYRFSGDSWTKVDTNRFTDFCLHLGQVYAATLDALFKFQDGQFRNLKPASGYLSSDTTVLMEDFSQVLADPVEIGPIRRIASYSGTLYLLRDGGLALMEGKTFVPDSMDWGTLPSRNTRDMLARGSRLFIATDRGLGVLRGMAMTALRGSEGLPFEDTNLSRTGV
jgi:hypothetical protein